MVSLQRYSNALTDFLFLLNVQIVGKTHIRGLSQKFADTALFCCFLNTIQIRSSYYDSIKHE